MTGVMQNQTDLDPVTSKMAHRAAAVNGAARFSMRARRGAWRDALLRRMLALGDLAAVFTACLSLAIVPGERSQALWAALFAPLWIVVAKLLGLYDRDQRSLRHVTADELPAIFTWAIVGTAVLALVAAESPVSNLTAGDALRVGITATTVAVVLRGVARFTWRRITPPERMIIVGDGTLARAAARKVELFPDMHVVLAGEQAELTEATLREWSEALPAVDRILVATPRLDGRLVAELVTICRHGQIKLSIVPPVRGMFGTAVQLNHIADLPVVQYNTWDVSRSTMLLKRAVDVSVAATMLVLFAPAMLLISLLVLIESGRPILFTQARVGQHGRLFRMLKFRTMVTDADRLLSQLVSFDSLSEPVFKLRDDPRVTRLGRLLRQMSLDELPQLVNVLKGDMSLVGPRPEQVELVERYSEPQRVRLSVKPGLTGPMQVYGRGQLTFEERLALEREYIENMSLGRDLHILGLTVASVLQGRGAF
jgi:exopolysaccharide biosynthesis polyprenyl glycosylphosphotransferase